MKLRTLSCLLLAAAIATQASGSKDDVTFTSQGVAVRNLKPGTRIAWLSLTRTRSGHHPVLSTRRGVEVVTPAGNVSIGRPRADESRSMWLFASADGDFSVSTIPPGYEISRRPVLVEAIAGATSITVHSPAVELLYVRRNGTVWFRTAADGGPADADGVQDTSIVLRLDTFEVLHGGGHPRTVANGDVILVIDPVSNRMSTVEVGR